jgi:transcriptional regulator with XRE-family HTH domain
MPTPTPSYAGDPVLVALGRAVQALRKERGLSQEALATDSGVERAYLSGIERGVQNLTVMTLTRVAATLGVTLAEIMLAAQV